MTSFQLPMLDLLFVLATTQAKGVPIPTALNFRDSRLTGCFTYDPHEKVVHYDAEWPEPGASEPAKRYAAYDLLAADKKMSEIVAIIVLPTSADNKRVALDYLTVDRLRQFLSSVVEYDCLLLQFTHPGAHYNVAHVLYSSQGNTILSAEHFVNGNPIDDDLFSVEDRTTTRKTHPSVQTHTLASGVCLRLQQRCEAIAKAFRQVGSPQHNSSLYFTASDVDPLTGSVGQWVVVGCSDTHPLTAEFRHQMDIALDVGNQEEEQRTTTDVEPVDWGPTHASGDPDIDHPHRGQRQQSPNAHPQSRESVAGRYTAPHKANRGGPLVVPSLRYKPQNLSTLPSPTRHYASWNDSTVLENDLSRAKKRKPLLAHSKDSKPGRLSMSPGARARSASFADVTDMENSVNELPLPDVTDASISGYIVTPSFLGDPAAAAPIDPSAGLVKHVAFDYGAVTRIIQEQSKKLGSRVVTAARVNERNQSSGLGMQTANLRGIPRPTLLERVLAEERVPRRQSPPTSPTLGATTNSQKSAEAAKTPPRESTSRERVGEHKADPATEEKPTPSTSTGQEERQQSSSAAKTRESPTPADSLNASVNSKSTAANRVPPQTRVSQAFPVGALLDAVDDALYSLYRGEATSDQLKSSPGSRKTSDSSVKTSTEVKVFVEPRWQKELIAWLGSHRLECQQDTENSMIVQVEVPTKMANLTLLKKALTQDKERLEKQMQALTESEAHYILHKLSGLDRGASGAGQGGGANANKGADRTPSTCYELLIQMKKPTK